MKKENNIAKDERSTTEKLNSFFRRNNYLIVIGLSAMMLITMCDNRSYKKQVEEGLKKNTEYLRKNISTIGFVSANGVIATIDRKAVDYNDDRIKNAIVNDIADPFLQGAKEIKKGKVFPNVKTMVKKNEKFYDLYYHKTKNKQNVSRILGAIFKMVSALYYPEYITVMKKQLNAFYVSRNIENKNRMVFHGSVRYLLRTKSWIPQLNKWVDEDVSFTIDFKGEIDPSQYANSDNLLGYAITGLKMPLLQKPKLSDLNQN